MSRTVRFGYSGISSTGVLMGALVEPRGYVALSYHAIHVVEMLHCSLLQSSTFDGRWEALRRVAERIYCKDCAITVVYGIIIVSKPTRNGQLRRLTKHLSLWPLWSCLRCNASQPPFKHTTRPHSRQHFLQRLLRHLPMCAST